MKSLIYIFNRVLVIEFYRINIGFFFLAIGFFFGFLSGREHKALAEAFVSSPILLVIPFSIWAIYLFKILGFNNLSLSQKENFFLYQSGALSKPKLTSTLIIVAFNQLGPIIIYGLFLILVAIKLNQLTTIILITVFILILITIVTWKLLSGIHHPNKSKTISTLKNKIDRWLTKPFIWFYPEWILRRQPLMVLGTKLFAALLIIGISRLYLFDEYDARLMSMGTTLSFIGNIVIIYYYQRFENYHFAILRSLPFSISQRIFHFIIVIATMNLLEWGVLFSYFPEALPAVDLLILYFYGLSIYLLSYTYLFTKDISLEKFINNGFVVAFALIILILFKVPLLLIAITHLILSIVIFRKNFYLFEFTEETGSEK